MPNLKLTYFDFDGGRGETIRLALTLGKVAFEDNRVSFAQWDSIKNQLPYGAMPVLHVDGLALAQSNAIGRYVGKLTDLYPSDPWQAAQCDEVMETVEDMTMHISATISMSDEEKKLKRQLLVSDTLPPFLKGLEAKLIKAGGKFFSNERLTVADLKSNDFIQWLSSGTLDHIPADFVAKTAPTVLSHSDRIKNDPRVKSYYEGRAKLK